MHYESGWTRQIRTFGEFNFYRPEGSELAKKSASSTLDEAFLMKKKLNNFSQILICAKLSRLFFEQTS